MIKKLRRRFLIMALISVTTVLFGVVLAINLICFTSFSDSADRLIKYLVSSEGFTRTGEDDGSGNDAPNGEVDAETPYVTRYFEVDFDADGNVTAVVLDNVAAVDADQAVSIAEKVHGSAWRKKGYTKIYRFLVLNENERVRIIFLNCSRLIRIQKTLLFNSSAIGLVTIIAVMGLVWVLSGRALKPIATSYDRQRRFITNASHELKTPLAVIDANADVLELENGDSEWTRSIKAQVDRLARLTNDLVTLSRLDEVSGVLEKTEFCISDAICEALGTYVTPIELAGKTLQVDIVEGMDFRGNLSFICKLVDILADNALKYSDNEGTISVSLKKHGKNAVLTFENSVDEINVGPHDELFTRFYRMDEARCRDNAGFGLGLSIARSIVESCGGKISAHSPNSKTIVFTAILPLGRD